MDELHAAVNHLAPWKAPGLDGFPPWFFQHYWDIIKHDLFTFISQAFILQAYISPCNNTLITLIHKWKTQKTPSDWRPTSLCNTTYKILSKIISLRLKPILPLLLEPNQGAFT